MTVSCPRCGHAVSAENVNVTTDVATCRTCDNLFKLSECIAQQAPPAVALDNPPAGAFYEERSNGFIVGASTRSPIAFFLVPFMLLWSGGALGDIYGSQITHGRFNPAQSLFGIPFIIVGILFWSLTLMALVGRSVITVDGDAAELFVGIGTIGWRRRFRWSDIKTVTEDTSNVRYAESHRACLSLEGSTRIKFGSNLNDERRYFVLHALRHRLKRVHPAPEAPSRS